MPRPFARVIVVVALPLEVAKEALDLPAPPLLEPLAGLGLIGGVDRIDRGLEQVAHQRVGRFEDRRTDQPFQLLHQRPGGGLRLEARHHLRDFLLLRPAEMGRRADPDFFFVPTAASCSRVRAMTAWAYCSTRA